MARIGATPFQVAPSQSARADSRRNSTSQRCEHRLSAMISREDGSKICAGAGLNGHMPPIGIEPEIEVVIKKGREPHQRQPWARWDRVSRVNRYALAHREPERRPVPVRALPAGDVRMQPDCRPPAADDVPPQWRCSHESRAGQGQHRPTRADDGPGSKSRNCSQCPGRPETSGRFLWRKDPRQVNAYPNANLVGVNRDVPISEPQHRAILRDGESIKDLHSSSTGTSCGSTAS